MHAFELSFGTVFAWGIACTWVAILAIFVRGSRQRLVLKPLDASAIPNSAPRLSVVVAARNESDCIETCLRSLFRQDYADLEVIAVNDRSTDDTAEILDRLASEFGGRLKVIHVAVLPAGWFGKPHALTLGVREASGCLICFTDADCEFESPATLRTTVAELLRRKLDFYSVAAQYTMTSVRESVVVPCCSEALVLWLRPERVDNPATSDVFANGAFMLVRKEAYDQIGGWGAVRTQISEDLQLARLAKSAGLRVGVSQGEGLYTTRAYPTARESWNGWSRILKGTLNPTQLAITVVRMLVLFVLPLVSTLCGFATWLRTGSSDGLTRGAGLPLAIAFCLRTLLDFAVFRLVGAPLAAVMLAPLGRLFVMAASIRALLSHAGLVQTYWRGAAFSAGQLVKPRPVQPAIHIPETRAGSVSVPPARA